MKKVPIDNIISCCQLIAYAPDELKKFISSCNGFDFRFLRVFIKYIYFSFFDCFALIAETAAKAAIA